MRIDRYLWNVRIFKTRSLATKACQTNKVLVDKKKIKPSYKIKPKDFLSIKYGEFYKTFTILDLPTSRQNAQKINDFIQETTPENISKIITEKQKIYRIHRSSVKGRPTKKDRRRIDQITNLLS